jgi:hypothetical protein
VAFTTSAVQYDFLGTKLSISIPIDTETPTLDQIDAAVSAFCDELDTQGVSVAAVSRTLLGSDSTGTFWEP